MDMELYGLSMSIASAQSEQLGNELITEDNGYFWRDTENGVGVMLASNVSDKREEIVAMLKSIELLKVELQAKFHSM